MDFTPSEAAADLAGLAADIAAAVSTPARVADLEAGTAPIDDRLWRKLAGAGLLGLAAPEDDGGAGLGPEETVAVAIALGRHLSRVPYGSHAVAAVPVLATAGSARLRAELLGPAATGAAICSAAVEEDLGVDLHAPSATLTASGGSGLALSGSKVNVPYAAAADALLVSVTGPDGPAVTAVRTGSAGVRITETPSTGLTPVYQVDFTEVPVADDDVLTGGAATLARTVDLLRLAVAADQTGVIAAALEATATYAREREQFGRPIGSFQAVAQRLADGYIDVQALTLTTEQAAWLLSPEAGADAGEISSAVATAKFWAAEAGHRVAHTSVHVHGGVGLDTSHPAHRYFLRAKQNEFTLGTAPVVLDDLGAVLAASGLPGR
ncbi:acyl-CoA dehydrogenase family protein [Gordonia sp. VNK21]|uniref:acyl-CoA dehydrogenase family protein n=1 Tax=Gordonia sp. VNK21 TaxID=3382483 RepID=UPI0038D4B24A